jgi:oleate hydratase
MSTYYFIGSGIASLAGAAYLIRDGNIAGRDIVIFEEAKDFGGALDAHGNPQMGYFMSGSRMFESKYNCTFDLMSSIPSASDANLSEKEETERAASQSRWFNRARLVNKDREIINFHQLGFSGRDRIDLVALIAKPEKMLDSMRITDCFAPHFFQTNFWFEWCTLFAFEKWHSAIEFRRYLLRFIHHFSSIDTQEDIFRTRYNQYDSIAAPLVKWLKAQNVQFRLKTRVTHIGFKTLKEQITVDAIQYKAEGIDDEINIAENDRVFITIGSMTADKTFGTMSEAPVLNRTKTAGAWQLWETIAKGRKDFGNPTVFDSSIPESSWVSFTVTMTDPTFFELIEAFSGSEAGTGGLITFKDSSWLITISIFHQPYFQEQPSDVFIWWGYGLYHDRPGDYIKKTMAECTGAEILEEVLGHLQFNTQKDKIIAASNCIPCMMPYITSQFLVRKAGDRPAVVPKGSTNLAFLGQYAEVPDEVVFTVEYSVRTAQIAVYKLLKLDKKPLPVYKGQYNPHIIFDALKTLHR